jgi:hypothetical protein
MGICFSLAPIQTFNVAVFIATSVFLTRGRLKIPFQYSSITLVSQALSTCLSNSRSNEWDTKRPAKGAHVAIPAFRDTKQFR